MNENELLALLSGERLKPIYVCHAKMEVASLAEAKTGSVFLSRDTVIKQEAKHKRKRHDQGIDLDTYVKAPEVIRSGFPRVMHKQFGKPQLVFVKHYKDADKVRSYKAVVKATKQGHELFLVSIHRVDKSDVRNLYKKSHSVKSWKNRRGVR
jgi:uncharacterized protein YcgL (UPF0745 family)